MKHTLVIRPEAESDIAEAYACYELHREGLGHEYLLCVEAVLEALGRAPLAHASVHREVRRALMRRFPYGVFYFIDDHMIVVLAVFHCRRDPSAWQKRT